MSKLKPSADLFESDAAALSTEAALSRSKYSLARTALSTEAALRRSKYSLARI